VIQHGDDGAFGLVVNHPSKAEGLPFPVFAGGPCQSPGLLMLHGHADWVEEKPDQPPPAVAPGVFMGDAGCVRRVSEPEPGQDLHFRMFLGYAGWAAGQLEQELASGAWAVVAAQGSVLFETPAEDLWKDLLPPVLPQPSLN
jgi:putative transcriptional regulator